MKQDPTLKVIHAALTAGQPTYARRSAERLLDAQPGHLQASVALARTLIVLGQTAMAEAQLTRVLQVDPEDLSAWQTLAQVRETRGNLPAAWNAVAAALALVPDDARLKSDLTRLGGGVIWPGWLNALVRARIALLDGRFAEAAAAAALGAACTLDPLPELLQLEAHWRAKEAAAARGLAEHLLSQSPRLAKPRLILGECLLASAGPEGVRGPGGERAVALLHEAAGLDPGGQVAARLWGDEHRFEQLWPALESGVLDGPVPAEVTLALGWNVLAAGPAAAPAPAPEPAASEAQPPAVAAQPESAPPSAAAPTKAARRMDAGLSEAKLASARLVSNVAREIRGELAHFTRAKRPRIKLGVGQAYLIVSSRQRLTDKYGPEGFARIERLLQGLQAEINGRRSDMAAGVVMVDDPHSLREYNLSPVDPQNAGAVKSLLADIDTVVHQTSRDRSQLSALLFIGGDDVVAHHRLPNPADDSDGEILSDSPYAAQEENYFVAERAVGRIPDGTGDLNLLCSALQAAITAHQSPPPEEPWWLQILRRWLGSLLPPLAFPRGQARGFSASIWRRASLAAFTAVGDAKHLRICPPTTQADYPIDELASAMFAYFNLHGLPDAAEWYGQRDPLVPADYPAFPVALKPADLHGVAPRVVYTEACYGAAVSGKTPSDSLALSFLANGTQAVVGSTCSAYGGVSTPLMGADLLGRLFLLELAQGATAGEALRRAKQTLAHIMQQRQGALDGEDQKTLIGFVLYGDPTARISAPQPVSEQVQTEAKRGWDGCLEEPALVCTKGATVEAVFDAPVDVVTQIRREVAQYLPGMDGAELRCIRPHQCRDKHPGHECPTQHFGPLPETPGYVDQTLAASQLVFTLQKTIRSDERLHPRVVRVTTTQSGQLIKMAMSK